jgi:hypothetical protein
LRFSALGRAGTFRSLWAGQQYRGGRNPPETGRRGWTVSSSTPEMLWSPPEDRWAAQKLRRPPTQENPLARGDRSSPHTRSAGRGQKVVVRRNCTGGALRSTAARRPTHNRSLQEDLTVHPFWETYGATATRRVVSPIAASQRAESSVLLGLSLPSPLLGRAARVPIRSRRIGRTFGVSMYFSALQSHRV